MSGGKLPPLEEHQLQNVTIGLGVFLRVDMYKGANDIGDAKTCIVRACVDGMHVFLWLRRDGTVSAVDWETMSALFLEEGDDDEMRKTDMTPGGA